MFLYKNLVNNITFGDNFRYLIGDILYSGLLLSDNTLKNIQI